VNYALKMEAVNSPEILLSIFYMTLNIPEYNNLHDYVIKLFIQRYSQVQTN